MANFTYKAKDRTGNTVTGNVEADSEKTAAGKIREMGHFPVEIQPFGALLSSQVSTGTASPVDRYLVAPFWTGVNIRHLAIFYRQLSTMLTSGMSLSEALRSIANRTRGRLGSIIYEVMENVERGGHFSETLSRYPHIFSSLQVSLLRAGESSGLLDSMIDRIASYLEYELKVRQMISKILIYPIVIFFFIITVVVCLPHIKLIINGNGSQFLQAILPGLRIYVMSSVVGFVALKFLFGFGIVKLVWDSIKILPPVLGTVAQKLAMSRFSRALAVLYAAGLPLSEAVMVASDASANFAIGNRIKRAVPRIREGYGLTESLERTRAVIPMVLDMLMVGEKTGSMDDVLFRVADYMDAETDATIHKAGVALFVLCLLIAGVIICTIVVQFFSNLYGGMVGGA